MANNYSSNAENLKQEIDELSDTIREADQFHTLEEQVADMKRRGVNPADNYDKWDDEDKDDWDNEEWKHKTPDDLK